jgi:hypothetical protein
MAGVLGETPSSVGEVEGDAESAVVAKDALAGLAVSDGEADAKAICEPDGLTAG